MDRDIFGGIGIKVDERSTPLVEALEKLGVEIGSVKLQYVARLIVQTDMLPANTKDARLLCVAVESMADAKRLIRETLPSHITPGQLDAVGPPLVVPLGDRFLLVFLGAIGINAAH